jgi:hypothetical protein
VRCAVIVPVGRGRPPVGAVPPAQGRGWWKRRASGAHTTERARWADVGGASEVVFAPLARVSDGTARAAHVAHDCSVLLGNVVDSRRRCGRLACNRDELTPA